MSTTWGVSVAETLEDFKDELRKHVARMNEERFFQSEAAYQKALDNIDSLSEEDWRSMNTPREFPGVRH